MTSGLLSEFPSYTVRQGEGDELQQVRTKLQGILEARKGQYAIADVHVGLGGADSPRGAPPAVITLRCAAVSGRLMPIGLPHTAKSPMSRDRRHSVRGASSWG